MGKHRGYEFDPAPIASGEEVRALTDALTKLANTIERREKELLSGREAARYLGTPHPTFHRLVNEGVIPQTRLSEGTNALYSRKKLDRLIEENTEAGQ